MNVAFQKIHNETIRKPEKGVVIVVEPKKHIKRFFVALLVFGAIKIIRTIRRGKNGEQ